MRASRSIALINSKPWIFDFRRNHRIELPKEFCTEFADKAWIFQEWQDYENWSSWHKRLRYINYENEAKTKSTDYIENKKKHAIEAQPQLLNQKFMDKIIETVKLPFPMQAESLSNPITDILFAGFGTVELRKFHEDTVQLKNVPSVGCRHGLDALICDQNNVFYYNNISHELLKIDAPEFYSNQGRLLRIFFRPDVYMWRYETSNCLVDVYLDLGHVLSVIGLIAWNHGIFLYEVRDSTSFFPVDLECLELVCLSGL